MGHLPLLTSHHHGLHDQQRRRLRLCVSKSPSLHQVLIGCTTALKPNATEVIVSNLWCNGSHGISVGSLGQVGRYDDQVKRYRY